MGRYGGAILTIAGAVVGAYFGAPALGAFIGGLAGQLLFPTQLPTVNGPRLADITQTNSTVGGPIPRGWGTFAVPGMIIAQSDLREVIESEEVGGKGAPSQTVNTPTYYQDFAIGLNGSERYGEGEIAGVRTIWANGKAIYDRRPRRAEETDADFQARMVASDRLDDEMVVYTGTETQLPDPTLEAFYGAGQISAFRGLAYIVFINWQNKPEDGNRMPAQWKFECYTAGAPSVGVNTEYSNQVLHDWLSAGLSPINDNNVNVLDDVFTIGVDGTLEEYVDTKQAGRGWATINLMGAANWAGITPAVAFPVPAQMGNVGFSNQDSTHATLYLNLAEAGNIFDHFDKDGAYIGSLPHVGLIFGNPNKVGDTWWSQFYGLSLITNVPSAATFGPSPPWEHATTEVDYNYWLYTGDELIEVDRFPGPPADPCAGRPALGELPGYCVASDQRLAKAGAWTRDNNPYLILQDFIGSDQPNNGGNPVMIPLNPALPASHPDALDEAMWTAAYEAAVARGDSEPGKVYVAGGGNLPHVQYPISQGFGYFRTQDQTTIETAGIPLSEVVTDLCLEAGMLTSDLNVTALEPILVTGYVRTRQMVARAGIDPLRQAYFFDMPESLGKLKAVRRGGPVERTFTNDDLAMHELGEEPPTKVATSTAQEVDLPRLIRVHYLAPSRDYEQGEQASPARIETDAVNDLDIELPLVLTDDEALQIAQVLWADSWVGRTGHQIAVDMQHADLEASDCVAIPVDDVLQRVRLTAITDKLPLVRQFETTRDDDGAYVSTAIASVPPYIPPPISFPAPVAFLLMDLPALRDSDDDAGFYGVVRPLLGGAWRGAALYRSVDGGANFAIVSQFANPAPIGRVLTPAGAGVVDVWDEASTLVVDVLYGSFDSRTAEAVIAGANAVAVGVHGRWEILQFRVAEALTDTQVKLTGMLRGRRGTERFVGTGAVDDWAVLLSTVGVTRVPMELAQRGTALEYRAVGAGGSLPLANTETFTGDAEALKPFAPTKFEVTVDLTNGDQVLSWIRRGRLGQEMPDGADIALSEEAELYEVDIIDPATDAVVRTLTAADGPSVRYLQADQESDFGLQGAYTATVYQISATVGRGPGTTISAETAFSVLPVITYPVNNLEVTFGGTPDGNEDVYVTITLHHLTGPVDTYTITLDGSLMAVTSDYADALASGAAGAFGPLATVTQPTSTSVRLATLASAPGDWWSYIIRPVYPYGTFTQIRDPLPVQAYVPQNIGMDLFVSNAGFYDHAPDADNRYRNGGSAVAVFTINGLTWEKQTALNYGTDRQILWPVQQDFSNQKHVCMLESLDELRDPSLSQFISSVGFNVIGGATVVNIAMRDGYRIVEDWARPTVRSSHPSTLRLAFQESLAGVPSYPTGAKQMDTAYFTPEYNAGPVIGYFAAGMDVVITLDGIDYSHSLDASEAAAFNDDGGLDIAPAVVATKNAVYDDLEAQIEGSGDFTVLHELQSNGVYRDWRIERNVANTAFTIAMSVSGFDITVDAVTFEG